MRFARPVGRDEFGAERPRVDAANSGCSVPRRLRAAGNFDRYRMAESNPASSRAFLRPVNPRARSPEASKALQAGCAGKREVILVSMPFGPLRHSSIGLSLLKAGLQDVPAKILYFTLPFAERVGEASYARIARGEPRASCEVGEWIFSRSVFENGPDRSQAYLDEVLKREAGPRPISKKFLRDILRARKEAGAFLDACVEQVLAYAPRIVGFTSVSQQQLASLGLAKRLKARHPEVSILFGGANCEGVMGLEILRQFPYVDVVVSGEGDIVFPELVHRILNRLPPDDLQGVYTHRRQALAAPSASPATAPSVRDMDALPFPDYEDFYDQWNASRVGKKHSPILLFETSRGCWWGAKHHCTFCGLNGTTMTFRSKTAKRAVEELVYLAKRYPGASVTVVDNILDMKYFKDFFPELARRRLKLNLFYEVKANLSKEQVRQLCDAGITKIQPGIESLSDSVLKLMRKGTTGLQNIQLLKWCEEVGIRPVWNFLWGFPGESPEEYARMAGMLPLLTHLPPPYQGTPISLYRFSPNFDRGEEMGFAGIAPCPAYGWIYPFPSEVLFNLAYYFDYDYREQRDVAGYTKALAERIAEWQGHHGASELFYLDRGAHLLIWDFRPMASRSLTVLDGLARELYLACDKVSSTGQLAREHGNGAGSIQMIEDALGPLLERGLMVRDGDRVLSLAVRRASEPSAKEGKKPPAVMPRKLPSVPWPHPGSARNAAPRADFPGTGPAAKSADNS
jgi:ribosomal peptide maturation radical SAM protein 1